MQPPAILTNNLELSGDRLYIGDPLSLIFSVTIENIASPAPPSLNQVSLRFIGKKSLADPDDKALFDSDRPTTPYCTIVIDTATGTTITGRINIDGEATAKLGTYKRQPETVSHPMPVVPIYFAFTALYQGASRRKVLQTGEITLRRDRVEDP